jgi:hypothetical protein
MDYLSVGQPLHWGALIFGLVVATLPFSLFNLFHFDFLLKKCARSGGLHHQFQIIVSISRSELLKREAYGK